MGGGSLGDLARNVLVSVGTASVQVSPPPVAERKVYSIINSSSGGQVITVNLGFQAAVANQGVVLQPGQAWVDSSGEGYKCFQGPITAISSAASGQVSIMER
jgi:hypothetical protein